MKKIIAFALSAMLIMGVFAGCSDKKSDSDSKTPITA